MPLPITPTVTAMLLRCGRLALGLSGAASAAQEAGSAKIAVGDGAAWCELKAPYVASDGSGAIITTSAVTTIEGLLCLPRTVVNEPFAVDFLNGEIKP